MKAAISDLYRPSVLYKLPDAITFEFGEIHFVLVSQVMKQQHEAEITQTPAPFCSLLPCL